MKEKGFTVVELIICFALISIIVVGMFNIALSYRGNAQTSTTKLELEKYKMDVTREIQNDVMDYSVDHVKYCDNVRSDCIKFVYNNGMEKTLELAAVNPTNRYIQYDGRKFVIEDDFDGIVNPTLSDVSTLLPLGGITLSVSFQNNSSIYKIDIPITHTAIEGDYGIHMVVLGTGTNPGIFKSIVTFDPNGGSVYPTSKEVINSFPYGELPIPTREGYDFTGWYTEEGTLVTEDTIVTRIRNHTLYAHWTPKWYTVTFDPNGGTVSPTTKSYQYTKRYGELPTPERKGHTFEGWYTERIGGTKITSTSRHNIPSNRTLYAHWTANEYKITYNKNGGTGTNKTDEVLFGTSYTTRGNFFTRTDYEFTGWNERSNGSGVDWTSKINNEWIWDYDKNVTLYAQWKKVIYVVTYVTDTSKSYQEKVRVGDSVLNPTTFTPSKSGYTFVGWSTRAKSSEVLTSKVMGEEDITLYAVYKKDLTQTFVSSYTSEKETRVATRYYNGSGDYINGSVTAPTGLDIIHWTWLGWSAAGATLANATVTYANGATISNITQENTYYGLYRQEITQTFISTTTVTRTATRYYNAAGNYNSPYVTTPNGGSMSGWTWRGWGAAGATSSTASVAYDNGDTISNLTTSNTYYGLYSKELTQTFRDSGAVTNPIYKTATRYYNAAGNYNSPYVTTPNGGWEFSSAGWKWRGWSASGATAGNASVAYSNGAKIYVTSNNTFYGLYSKTIYLNYNGNNSTSGSMSSQSGTRYMSSSGNYKNPTFTLRNCSYTRAGYKFIEWLKGSISGYRYSAGSSVTLESTTTFYARWQLR